LAELHEARVNSATHVETSAQRMRIEAGLWSIKPSLLNALSQNEMVVVEVKLRVCRAAVVRAHRLFLTFLPTEMQDGMHPRLSD
jgi:hypothetical protein